MLKPSKVLSTASSAQSLGNAAHGGSGTLTRRPVTCVLSATVARLDGNGWSADVPASAAAGKASAIAVVTATRSQMCICGKPPLDPPGCDCSPTLLGH